MYGDKRNDIKIINNGIDADKFGYADADRMKCRAELNLGSKIVFAYGPFVRSKKSVICS